MSASLEHILGWLAGWTTAIITAMGYPGIALLMALGSACIPLPSEIVMPFAGYLVAQGTFGLVAAATAGAIGSSIGSTLAYAVGRRGGRPLIETYGRYVFINLHDLDRADRFFARFGSAAVLIGQMIPIIRSFIAFPAGIVRMPFPRFIAFAIAGAWPWSFLLTWLGMKLGAAWNSDPRVKAAFHSFDVVIVIMVVAGAGWYLWRKVRSR